MVNIVKWFAICLFIALAQTDNLQPAVAAPILEVGNRVVRAGEVLFEGGCEHVFRCEKVLKDISEVDLEKLGE